MREDLIEQLEAWHEEDEFDEIVDAITEISEEERDYELTSHLGRALNNLERYEEAVQQFLSIEKEGQKDPLWHYRIGLAYYYLDRYEEARNAFETADRLEPGDEDTLEFLELLKNKEQEEAKKAADEAVHVKIAAGDVNLADFWDDSDPAAEQYKMAPPTDGLISSVEEELVFKLPGFYVHMMKQHNGGVPRKRNFPISGAGSAGQGSITISGILGIGREKSLSLCGSTGSRHIIEQGGYPEIGVVIATCPSDTEIVMLDYRESGNDGIPEVVHVDKANGNKITRLAPSFEAFIGGLSSEA